MFNSPNQAKKNQLYIAGQSYGVEQMVQHCLWKVLSETGLIYNDQLTEMESIVLSELLKKKYASGHSSLPGDSAYGLDVLNKAIDKIVCQIKTWQLQNQKYHSVIAENHNLKSGLRGLINISGQAGDGSPQLKMDRPIADIGLSKRTVRLLQSMGIDNLTRLRSCAVSRLRNHARIGVKTLHEIETVLSKYSLPDPGNH